MRHKVHTGVFIIFLRDCIVRFAFVTKLIARMKLYEKFDSASMSTFHRSNIRSCEKCLSFTTMHLYTNIKSNLSKVVISVLIEENGS